MMNHVNLEDGAHCGSPAAARPGEEAPDDEPGREARPNCRREPPPSSAHGGKLSISETEIA
jgi:hypothetical protein